MGIDGFHKWIEKEYGEIYLDIKNTNNIYHHLYIDLNYLLHICHYNSNNEVHLINKMSVVLLDICKRVCPVKSVNLFCDGTAPFAKMLIQRERRNKNKHSDEDIFRTTLNFTPGTQFIEKIPIKLEKSINIIKKYFNVKVNIDSINPGESEIKIKKELIENYKKNIKDKHILVTNDADVVLILSADDTYKNTNILINDKVIPINKLLEKHFKKYNCDINNLDFVFLNLLLGNDYIPKVRELSLNKIWDSYSLNIEKYKYLIKKEKEKYIFNKQLLIDILNDCIGKIGKTKIIKNNKIYDNELYKNYFDGVIWTLQMYNEGKCTNYEYICNSNKPIDILNLIIYLYDYEIDKYNYLHLEPIPSILCGILLLPKNAQELINKKYKKFMEDVEVKKIYDENFKISIDFIKKIKNKFKLYEDEL
jgi:hypothetical protein